MDGVESMNQGCFSRGRIGSSMSCHCPRSSCCIDLLLAFRAMNPSFWRDKRVLVTGHTGFKGAGFASC